MTTTEVEARALLDLMCPQTADPSLTSGEFTVLVEAAKRRDSAGNPATNVVAGATAWSSIAWQADDVIYESGRFWRCLQAGTSGATEPTWPDLTVEPIGGTRVVDNDVVWVDNGAEWQPSWNLDYAACLGWRVKAGKVAHRFDFAADGQKFDRSQLHAMCLEQATVYGRAGLTGSVTVSAER